MSHSTIFSIRARLIGGACMLMLLAGALPALAGEASLKPALPEAFQEIYRDKQALLSRITLKKAGSADNQADGLSGLSVPGQAVYRQKLKKYQPFMEGKNVKPLPGFADKRRDPWLGESLPASAGPSKGPSGPTDNDATPPTAPQNITAFNEGMQVVLARWEASEDPESGIKYYVFGIGHAPGQADVRWWQLVAPHRKQTYFHPLAWGVEPGDTVYVSVYAINGENMNSLVASSGPVTVIPEVLGAADNDVTVDYAPQGFDTDGKTPIEGWSADEIERFDYFISRMVPIIREVYGAPARNNTVTFVKDLYYSQSNVYFAQYNEIHMSGQWSPQLLTHELVHAFRDNVIISSDNAWQFDPTLSGFEEGFAQAVSYECMNRYIEQYPDDPYVNTQQIWLSDYTWDYDFQNVPEVRSRDFWSDWGGMGLHWLRYELAAAAMFKIAVEAPDFYQQFNQAYYAALNTSVDVRVSRGMVVDLISALVPQIENEAALSWIDRQYIFDCVDVEGEKTWVRTQHYPYWQDYRINQWIYCYETFPNGSDWAYYDGQAWVLHHLNGSFRRMVVDDFGGSALFDELVETTPMDNPPDWYGFGWERKDLRSADTTLPDTTIDGLHELGLYRIRLFEPESGALVQDVYRVMGDALANSHGVWGGVIGAQGGVVYVDHEGFPPEPPLPVVNGVFHGTRTWAGIYNPLTGYYDTVPGRINLRYVDLQGRILTRSVNIDRGSIYGNVMFLLDAAQAVLPQQQLALNPGTNFVSFHVLPGNKSPENVFAALIAANRLYSVTSLATAKKFQKLGNRWINAMGDVEPLGCYWIQVTGGEPVVLSLDGEAAADPSSRGLKKGLNFIGFAEERNAMAVIQPLIASDALGMVTELGSNDTIRLVNGQWMDGIGQLERGKVYKFMVKQDGVTLAL